MVYINSVSFEKNLVFIVFFIIFILNLKLINMVTILNVIFAILLSILLITPLVLLIIILNRTNVKSGIDPSVIKRLEDMDTTIANDTNNALDQVQIKLEDFEARLADLEEQRTNVKGFKK